MRHFNTRGSSYEPAFIDYNHLGFLLQTWINFNPAWISNYIHFEVWDEITYPFLNFNGAMISSHTLLDM